MAHEYHRMAVVLFENGEAGVMCETEFKDGQLTDGLFRESGDRFNIRVPGWGTRFYVPVLEGAEEVDEEELIRYARMIEDGKKKLTGALKMVEAKKIETPAVKKGFYPKLAEFSEANDAEGYHVDESDGPQLVLLTKSDSWLVVSDIEMDKQGRATRLWLIRGTYWSRPVDYPEHFDVQWYIEVPPFMYEDSWRVKLAWAQDAKKEQDREEAERRSPPHQQRGGKRDKPDNANRAVRGKPIADTSDSRRIYRRKTLEDYL